jgi:hypothetical protein
MPFGGLGGMLPLRLGVGDCTGISAEHHARLSADLLAAHRTSPAVTLFVRVDASASTAQVLLYESRLSRGVKQAPKVAIEGGDLRVYLNTAANDYAEIVDLMPLLVSGAAFSCMYQDVVGVWHEAAVTFAAADATLTFDVPAATVSLFALYLYGADGLTTLGAYGAHERKCDSKREGSETYAWHWFQYFSSALGSAYGTGPDTVVTWGNIAKARAFGTSQRISEMLAASATPDGSDAKLDMWSAVLGVPQAGRTRAELRADCEELGRFPEAPTHAFLAAGVARILGREGALVSITSDKGTIAVPPTGTCGPSFETGDPAYDMGGGVWSSPRGHLVLTVQPRYGLTLDELLNKVNRPLAFFLDRVIRATSDWEVVSA